MIEMRKFEQQRNSRMCWYARASAGKQQQQQQQRLGVDRREGESTIFCYPGKGFALSGFGLDKQASIQTCS